MKTLFPCPCWAYFSRSRFKQRIGRRRTLHPPAFTPLPLGEVKQAGLLLDWRRSAANDITGHTDELDPLFEKGWLDADARFFW